MYQENHRGYLSAHVISYTIVWILIVSTFQGCYNFFFPYGFQIFLYLAHVWNKYSIQSHPVKHLQIQRQIAIPGQVTSRCGCGSRALWLLTALVCPQSAPETYMPNAVEWNYGWKPQFISLISL